MRKFMLFFAITFLQQARANDGVFYSTGNTLIPMKETTIRLKKEILNLERKGDWMQVDIYFEFFNPGVERELTVGFVSVFGGADTGLLGVAGVGVGFLGVDVIAGFGSVFLVSATFFSATGSDFTGSVFTSSAGSVFRSVANSSVDGSSCIAVSAGVAL